MSIEAAFADTNLFLRYLTNDVPEQADAVEDLLRQAAEGKHRLVTNAMVIAEIVWTLESFYRVTRSAIKEKVIAILNTPGLDFGEGDLLLQAITDYEDKNIDFIDAYNAAWMLREGLTCVYTFDSRHFARIEGIQVKRPGG